MLASKGVMVYSNPFVIKQLDILHLKSRKEMLI